MAHVGLESWASSVFSTRSTSALTWQSVVDSRAPEQQPFADQAEQQKHRKEALRAKFYIATFIVISFVGACLLSCVAPFYPTRAIEKGVSQTVVGLVLGIMNITGFITCWILVAFMFKIGVKFCMCAGMFIAGTSAILFGAIDNCPPGPSFLILSFCIRIFEGVGVSMYYNAAYSMAAIIFADNYALIIGLLETAASSGTLLGPTIGGGLFAAGGYFLPFTVLGGILLVLDPVAIFLVPSSISDSVNTASEEHSPLYAVRRMLTPAMMITAYTMLVAVLTSVFTATTLGVRVEAFGVKDPIVVAAIYLASSGAYAISAPISGRIADKTSYAWLVILIGCLMNVVGYLIIGPTPLFLAHIIPEGLPQLIAGCVLTHSGLSAMIIPTAKELQRQAELIGLDPNSIGTLAFITILFQSVWFLGGAIGSIMSSAMMDNLGFGWATTVQAGIVLTAFLLQFYIIFSHGIARQMFAKCRGYSDIA